MHKNKLIIVCYRSYTECMINERKSVDGRAPIVLITNLAMILAIFPASLGFDPVIDDAI